MSEELFDRVSNDFGLVSRSSWPHDIEQALRRMGRAHHLSEGELLHQIAADEELIRELAGYLTVDESHFLRHADHFRMVDKYVAARVGDQDTINIWSAGCAKGEEPYSVAMIIADQIGAGMLDRVRIFGSDINRMAIDKARQGVFTPWSFRGVSDEFIARHFVATPGGDYRVESGIARHVSFEHTSIQECLADMPEDSVDLLFFRNVAIYMAPQALQQVYDGFHRVLKPSGFLLTAPADPPPPAALFARLPCDGGSAFGRREHSEAHSLTVMCGPATLGASCPTRRPEAALSERFGAEPDPSEQGWPAPQADQESLSESRRRPRPIPNNGDRAAAKPARYPRQFAIRHKDDNSASAHVAVATELIRAQPASHHGYMLRGRLYLAEQRVEEAVNDFRRVLYLKGEDRVARFWYAAALQRAGRTKKAQGQIFRLAAQLASLPGQALLEDGQTSAAELLRAVELMNASMS